MSNIMKKANLILGCLIISAFIPFVSYSQVTDIDGNVYKTVEIGTQTWMAENLRTTKYNDSTSIPLVSDSIAWITMTSPAYCWYKNDSASYKATYGALYNGYAVSTEKLCPTGWHVPSSSEWKTMMREFLGGDANLSTISGGDSLAGYKLKESGSVHCKNQNPRTTNETG
ncbi:MAG: FISUMP domain-containing protein, partial [Bacteroidales bacterium]|nr:FISUMP domain-containing protein [Bacteroidales bacterium]